MIKQSLLTALGLMSTLAWAETATANDRYATPPPVIVSSNLTAPWITQLGGTVTPPQVYATPRAVAQPQVYQRRVQQRVLVRQQPQQPVMMRDRGVVQQVAMRPNTPAPSRIEPQFLPQVVSYDTPEKAGTIVIDTNNRFLYLVLADGKARRYGVGVGKPGFEWAGVHKVTRKAEWPNWTPPAEMISREAAKGHYLPARMDGGPENPLGARAMYLGSTLYRIHGTNAPWTIGSAVSSGCIRMRNEDVTDLYERVDVGTRVIVL
jgi:lipoprotein-anchoring transpeptidase ErfK/SrfK